MFQAAYPKDPMLQKTMYHIFICESLWRWPLQGRITYSIPKRVRKKMTPSLCLWMEATIKSKLRTYLVPIAVSIFKAGCRVEGWMRENLASHRLTELPSISQPTFIALWSTVNCTKAVQFDSDSYPIGIDSHASRCMVIAPHLFKNLKLGNIEEVDGIKSGLDIKGMGTFSKSKTTMA
jgi:hypothetical protein